MYHNYFLRFDRVLKTYQVEHKKTAGQKPGGYYF